MLTVNEPMIWTSKGNMLVSDLTYHTMWHDSDECTQFREVYMLGEEVVRDSTHVYQKKPLEFFGEQETF